MEIKKDYELTQFNTFGIRAYAKFFVEIQKEQDLLELFDLSEFKDNEKLFLGKGSNLLFVRDFSGIIVLNKLKGIEILEENENDVFVKSMGGEIWNDLVKFSVEKEYWGIENLSSIPGTVGAAPVQNIGAYGVELKDVLVSVETFDVLSGEKRIFSKEECGFGYRESVFKNEMKDKYFISAIVLKLSKKEKKKIEYRILKEYIEKNNLEIKKPEEIAKIVTEIRKNKLPDPRILGNAGSFFKNVFVDSQKLNELKLEFPEIPTFFEEEIIKIPTGWLIEQCGWKGKRIGNVGMHEKQALVLVNYGGATGEEIKNFADLIIDSVYKKFGLKINPEVNLI